MPKLNPTTARDHFEADGFAGHYGTLGDQTIGFETYAQDDDPAPMFAGLPDDRCQARHWGVVLEGTLIFNYRDGTRDVIEAGEAYYAPPGHLPIFTAGTRVVEFSPPTSSPRRWRSSWPTSRPCRRAEPWPPFLTTGTCASSSPARTWCSIISRSTPSAATAGSQPPGTGRCPTRLVGHPRGGSRLAARSRRW